MRMIAEDIASSRVEPFIADELQHCLNAFKKGISAGEDGIACEYLQVVAQIDLVHALAGTSVMV